ncbi:Cobalamin biosynthesis protein CbiB [Caloramator mitchellensis]|uniref:Cobalamin biosynthesis protein CobD n=1 Tax=Caloramator mitchellensis TaxID=908809 RepID=A0A0R3JXT3_CALMK|nr:adenosylcobinamide-phosphate synthase CbiB [Caloramator mitchellensis]KRQ85924.1 Cobalamin biosynthesis protein CbiB [Caloramator mitchellensis]
MIDIVIACILDLIIGDPYNFPHPVKLMGKLISIEEKISRKFFKDKSLYFAGFLIVILNISLAFIVPFMILKIVSFNKYIYHAVNIYLLYTTVAARCLRDEAIKIYQALNKSIEEARYRLSFIVGRDTNNLSKSEIIRATVETVAENTSDGVIAPLFYALFATPFAFVYKMVNTMDSMLGYINDKYKYIGYFPAKTDDLFNFIPARLTGILMIVSGIFKYDIFKALRIMIRDRKNHKSPNCAYPEGAVAGLLGVQLGGTNYYFGQIMVKPTIGDKIRELTSDDIKRTINIMFTTELIFLTIAFLLKK